ncbi:MAG: HEAT repeat domain-containing protein [Acidobacteriota bacterium]|nr:HEAT repeat domain-containing protein [Acidobacteriota bacterium]
MTEPTFEELLQQLSDPDEETRRFAAEDLGDLHNPEAIDPLVAALTDSAVAVREAAVQALIAIGGETVARRVAPLLDHPEAPVRNSALEVFESLRVDAIAPAADLYLSSTDSHDLRKIAVDTLGKIDQTKESKAFATLLQALDDPHINVATAACEALGRVGGDEAVEALTSHIGRHPWMDGTIFLALTTIGSDKAREALEQIDETTLEPQAVFALQEARSLVTP